MGGAFDYDIGVIGGGAAGLTVASGSAQLGARTLLVEKEGSLGGDCLHYGCVPSKTLIHCANVYHLIKNARSYGLPEADVRPVEFSGIASRISSVISRIQQHDSVERFCSLGANVEFGNAEFVDEHSVRLNGRVVSARSWVLATGSSTLIPAIDGLDSTPYITNREIFSLDRLPPSLAILGGGPIAIEMAQAFARLGSRVTVIQRGAQILAREDPDMAGAVMARLKAEGVSFILNAQVLALRDLGDQKEIALSFEGRATTVKAHTVMVATGRAPNVAGMALDNAGVEHGARGIVVDSRLRTSRKHIYAAGDVNGQYLFTHTAGYEGGIVVSNAIFHLPRKADYTHMPWCTYTDPELASIGMNESRAREAGLKYTLYSEEFRDNDRALAEGEHEGRIKMILDERDRPLGVQILGPHAGELISEWVAVMNAGVRLTTLAGAVHPYPTLAEINKRVAGDYLSPRIFSDRVRKGLRFFFSLKGRGPGGGTSACAGE